MRGWAAAAIVTGSALRCPAPAPPAIVTFNVENFPRSEAQIAGAFAELRALGAPIVAIQEVTDADRLRRAVHDELGPSWRVAVSDAPDAHRLAVAWDGDVVEAVGVATRGETRVAPGTKPTLEVRLRDRSGRVTRVATVHLKAGGDSAVPVRAAQLAGLDAAAAEGAARGDRVVLLGDFNAATEADRRGIAALASRTGLAWATERLACTSYWDRADGCLGVALDHVLTSEASAASVGGACAIDGCTRSDRCPTWRWDVSDHCPVVVR